jgi:hypothetical protein
LADAYLLSGFELFNKTKAAFRKGMSLHYITTTTATAAAAVNVNMRVR